MTGVVVVAVGVVVVVLGRLVGRVLAEDGAVVVVTRGAADVEGPWAGVVDVRSEERAALLCVARGAGVPVVASGELVV